MLTKEQANSLFADVLGTFAFRTRITIYLLLGDPESKRGGVNARRGLECLRENPPTIVSPGMTFIHDNTPTHTAHMVQDWLKEWSEEIGVTLVDRPLYSPDLNPVGNV